MMRRPGFGIVAAVASALLVTGCSVQVHPAAGPDDFTRRQYYHERAEAIVRALPAWLPEPVAVVRSVSDADWAGAIMACVSVYGLAPGKPNSYEISELICEQQYPSRSGAEILSTEAQRAARYNYFEKTLLPCLILLGQPILPSPAYRTATSVRPFRLAPARRSRPHAHAALPGPAMPPTAAIGD